MKHAVWLLILVSSASAALAGASAIAAPQVRAMVEIPPSSVSPPSPAARVISPFLYLNRCSGGCAIHGSTTNDARAHKTTIPPPGEYLISEFATATGNIGAAADADWAALVQCVKEVYSPFAITVSDVPPTGVSYNEAIVAGQPGEIGRPVDNLGVAPIASDCSPQNNVLSFSFANHHGGSGAIRIRDICWTAAQESAHAYGLDHEYVFTDGSSACRDAMTYRDDCGGQRFFRDHHAQCGEDVARACRCGGTQNSHRSLLAVFGAATPITAAPTVTIASPTSGSTNVGSVVHALAGAQRGVAKVELFLNGSRWSVVAGAPFGLSGQGDPVTHLNDYALPIPAAVPDGIIDIVAVASDDLGIATSSEPATITKGAPCENASQCAADQKCENGRCFWDPPSGELGDACSYSQACKSWDCADTSAGMRCVTDCQVDEPATCPAGFACADTGGDKGVCLASDTGGCCSAAQARRPWGAGLCSLALVALWLRPRRRRRFRRA